MIYGGVSLLGSVIFFSHSIFLWENTPELPRVAKRGVTQKRYVRNFFGWKKNVRNGLSCKFRRGINVDINKIIQNCYITVKQHKFEIDIVKSSLFLETNLTCGTFGNLKLCKLVSSILVKIHARDWFRKLMRSPKSKFLYVNNKTNTGLLASKCDLNIRM